MIEGLCALYARASTESQARDNTIASQVMALRERITAEGFSLEPDQSYVDEGYSGSILACPALERLRDAVAVARAKASDDQALIAHQQLRIEKLTRQLYGPRSERTSRAARTRDRAGTGRLPSRRLRIGSSTVHPPRPGRPRSTG